MFIFNRNKDITSKARIVVGGGLLFLLSIIGGLVTQGSVSAAMNSNTPPTDRAASYSYWKATSKCVTDHMRSTIKTQVGSNGATRPDQAGGGGLVGTNQGEWFDDLTAWVTVYPDGRLDCDQVMTRALSLWGWSDPKTFLTAMGYRFDSNIPAYVRANDNSTNRFSAFRDAVLGQVGNVVNLLDNSAKHALYLGMFTSTKQGLSSCNAKEVGLLSTVDTTQRNAAQNNQFRDGVNYTIVKVAKGTNVQDYVYTYSAQQQASGDTITGQSITNYASVWNYRGANYSGGTGEHFSCRDLVAQISNTANDFARWNNQNPNNQDSVENTPGIDSGFCDNNPDDPACAAGASSCVVDGVGWIVCPVFTFLGGVVDAAYGWVTSMLQVQPLVTTGEAAGTYNAWVVMRNIANVAFVIAFLFIIFSQLTGVGVSNYGIKKMLPRIVIAAILVNVSFWICAIAVDASNIIGSSIVSVFNSIGANISPTLDQYGNPILEPPSDTGNLWGGLVAIALAGLGLYYILLSALIPAVLAALVAIITVFLVLALRQALIVLLIVIAPLAFVAYLLPNTEGWFSKWRKLLFTLLIMYPIIAAIFGASALASSVVMQSARDNTIVQIMGAAIAIIPLAITPLVMKTAGGVLNRFAGIVNNAERGPIDRLRKVGDRYHQGNVDRRDAEAFAGKNQLGRGAFVRWKARRSAVYDGLKSNKGRNQQQYTADAMTTDGFDADGNKVLVPTKFANQVAGGNSIMGIQTSEANPAALQRALAGAKFTIEKAELEDIQAEKTFVSNMQAPDITAGLNDPSTSNARKAALLDRLITIGKPEDYAGYINQYGSDTNEKNAVLRSSIARSLSENGPKFLKGSNLDTIRTGTMDLEGKVQPDGTRAPISSFEAITKANSNVYSEKNMVADSNDNIQYAYSVADAAGKKKLIETAISLTQNPVLKGEIKHNEAAINFLVSQANVVSPQQASATKGPTAIATNPDSGSSSQILYTRSAGDVHSAVREEANRAPKGPQNSQGPKTGI